MKCLQDLDQDHAPDLPPHISVSSLTWFELRDIVVRARRRFIKCNSSPGPVASREIAIPIGSEEMVDASTAFGKPFGWAAEPALLPGGKFLLVKWAKGYLQCWNVTSRELAWTYPTPSQDEEVQDSVIHCFTYDMQANGDVHVLVVSEDINIHPDQRRLEVPRFTPSENTLTRLFNVFPMELDIWHGIVIFAKICGDVLAVYTGNLYVSFWKERRSIAIVENVLEIIEIIDEYLICIRDYHHAPSLIAIPLDAIHDLMKGDTPLSQVKLDDLPLTESPVTPPSDWLIGRSMFSACKFHWKAEEDRDSIVITVLVDVYSQIDLCEFPVAEFFLLMKEGDTDSPGPRLIWRGRFKASRLEGQFNSFNVMMPPSQAGSVVVAFHDDLGPKPKVARTFATFVRDRESTFCYLNNDILGHKPAMHNLHVEFYSGAVYFMTLNQNEVIIRYFD